MRLIVLLLLAAAAHAQPFDVVLAGGRVMDPETGLDAVRYVGLRGDRIAAVSETPLEGAPPDLVLGRARDADVPLAMSNSFAFGGNNAVVVLRRVGP